MISSTMAQSQQNKLNEWMDEILYFTLVENYTD